LIIGYSLLDIGYSGTVKLRWILSWQPDVQVLEPLRLRERIREKLQAGLGEGMRDEMGRGWGDCRLQTADAYNAGGELTTKQAKSTKRDLGVGKRVEWAGCRCLQRCGRG